MPDPARVFCSSLNPAWSHAHLTIPVARSPRGRHTVSPSGRPSPHARVAQPLHVGTRVALAVVQEVAVLYTLAVILLIAWLLGVVGTYTIGAFVHVLLVLAVVLFLIGLLSGRRTVV
jgi:Family of unknown function (DUF5670)